MAALHWKLKQGNTTNANVNVDLFGVRSFARKKMKYLNLIKSYRCTGNCPYEYDQHVLSAMLGLPQTPLDPEIEMREGGEDGKQFEK